MIPLGHYRIRESISRKTLKRLKLKSPPRQLRCYSPLNLPFHKTSLKRSINLSSPKLSSLPPSVFIPFTPILLFLRFPPPRILSLSSSLILIPSSSPSSVFFSTPNAFLYSSRLSSLPLPSPPPLHTPSLPPFPLATHRPPSPSSSRGWRQADSYVGVDG